MIVTVAGCQLASHSEDPLARVARMRELARAARSGEPDLGLIAFPELALTGYRLDASVAESAQAWPDGPALRQLSAVARELEVVLVVGYPELETSTGLLFDSAAIFDADGTPVGSYRKSHCLQKERSMFRNGDALPVWRTQAGTFGIVICWDAAMPEAARVLALKDPDFIIAIAAWEDPYLPDLQLAARARAFDNVLPVLAVNSTGRDENSSFSGGSCLIDCLGKVTGECGADENGLLVGRIDTSHTQRVRAGYGSQLRDRRPELYMPVADESAAFLNESRLWARG